MVAAVAEMEVFESGGLGRLAEHAADVDSAVGRLSGSGNTYSLVEGTTLQEASASRWAAAWA